MNGTHIKLNVWIRQFQNVLSRFPSVNTFGNIAAERMRDGKLGIPAGGYFCNF